MKILKILSVVALASLSAMTQAAETKTNPIVGAWRLLSYRVNHADGTTTDQFVKPSGQIVYTADGRMSVHLLDLDPPQCKPAPGRECSPAELSRAFGYTAYWGAYELAPDMKSVKHYVEHFVSRPGAAGNRTNTGTIFERSVKLEGDRVSLTTPKTKRGNEETTMTLVWERVKGRSTN